MLSKVFELPDGRGRVVNMTRLSDGMLEVSVDGGMKPIFDGGDFPPLSVRKIDATTRLLVANQLVGDADVVLEGSITNNDAIMEAGAKVDLGPGSYDEANYW